MLGHEVGVLTQPVAGALDLDDDGVVEQAVEQRGGDDGIAEDLAPFGEAAVGGQDHGALLVAGVDQLEEQIAAAGHDRQIADLVDDEEAGRQRKRMRSRRRAFALGLGERGDEVGEGGEVDAPAGLDRLDPERGGEMALARAGRAEQMHHLGAIDEVELGQRQDAVAVERGLEGEVEAGERLDRGEPGQSCSAVLMRRFSRIVSSSVEQGVDRLDAVDLALLDAAHGVVEHLQGARHLEADQVAA